MRILTVVGARPQFIKAAPVSRALRAGHDEVLVHSGQHYDDAMSDVFFRELGIPRPDIELGVGGGSHGRMTGEMLIALDELIDRERPDAVMVYGDTNTTLAAGLAAAKLHVPVAHVEAGLRSFDMRMPEEVNRVLVDRLSTLLLCPTRTAVENLTREGVTEGVALTGDVMLDVAREVAGNVNVDPVLERYDLEPGSFHLATVHRAATSDSPERLASVVRAFARLALPVVWPVHPRTRGNLERFELMPLLDSVPSVRLVDPLPYTETGALLRSCASLLTDSGGMQKEAYFFGVQCVTLRDTTEWVETIEHGWNRLVGTDEDAIVEAVAALPPTGTGPERPPVFGDGHSAEAIVTALESAFEA